MKIEINNLDMKARLIKLDNNYFLKIGDTTFATSATPNLSASIRHSISLKNCQAIERGYDLDELANEYNPVQKLDVEFIRAGFKAGFQKALEILGDRRFTERDINAAIRRGYVERQVHEGVEVYFETYEQFIQSLQQNEWEVEIMMEEVQPKKTTFIDPSTKRVITHVESIMELKPKLDAYGCLILKRVV